MVLLLSLTVAIWKLTNVNTDKYYEIVPVQFTNSKIPCVEVSIQGIEYPLCIDIASDSDVAMESSALQKISKRKIGVRNWENSQGKEFINPKYELTKIVTGSMVFQNILLLEIPDDNQTAYLVAHSAKKEKNLRKTVGYLGRGILKRTNLLLDMRSTKIIITNDVKRLKWDGYDLETFTKVPFEHTRYGIGLELETDLGRFKCLLTTTFTCTVLRYCIYPKNVEKKISRYGFPQFTTNLLAIKDKNFGPIDLQFLPITEKWKDVDGFLGMDFVQNHLIYIDFAKNLLYIRSN